jgi:hypothetical protein
VGGRVDVGEHRSQALPAEGVRCGDEGETRHDDLAGQFERTDGDLEGHRAVAHRHAMSNPNPLGQRRLEILYERAVIGQPLRLENLVDVSVKDLAGSDVGAANV